MDLKQVEQGFSSFYAKFLPYLMNFQSSAVPLVHSTLKKIIKYGKNLANNEEKPSSPYFKSIYPWHCGLTETQILGTRSATSKVHTIPTLSSSIFTNSSS